MNITGIISSTNFCSTGSNHAANHVLQIDITNVNSAVFPPICPISCLSPQTNSLSSLQKEKIGLFFGSFNPIHHGHLALASHMAEHTDVDAIWLIVSPQNPFKRQTELADIADRLAMAKLATQGSNKIFVSDLECKLPYPSYTTETLRYIKTALPSKNFVLIMGTDTMISLPIWKDAEEIQQHPIYVYPRSCDLTAASPLTDNIKMLDATEMEVSSTAIRTLLMQNENVQSLLPDSVLQFIETKKLYSCL